jgi:hypothetical protein
VVGTIDDLIFYKMDGKYYIRMKPCIDPKQVKFGKRYRNTMRSARRLACGSKIAALIYKALPEGEREFSMYRVMVGEAVRLLKVGKTDEEVLGVLKERYLAKFEVKEVCVRRLREQGYRGKLLHGGIKIDNKMVLGVGWQISPLNRSGTGTHSSKPACIPAPVMGRRKTDLGVSRSTKAY